MCTVSLIPCDDGFRLGCNRDERRDRPPASPPRLHAAGSRTAIFPVDSAGPGTWVGVNDAGLAAVLLNRSTLNAAVPQPMSRGLIVPEILAASSLAQALAFLRVLRPPSFLPFVVVLALNRRLAIATSDGRALSVTIRSLCQPVVFASSSLGDRLVQTTRGRLFERLVLRSSDPTGAQRRFHSHRWVDRPELSIVMERSDARTVSRTFIQARSRTIEMQYEAL